MQEAPQWLQIRERNADILASHLRDLEGVRVPDVPADVQHAYDKFYAYVENRDAVMQELNKQGIPATVGSCSEDLPRESKRLGETPPQRFSVAGDEPLLAGASHAQG